MTFPKITGGAICLMLSVYAPITTAETVEFYLNLADSDTCNLIQQKPGGGTANDDMISSPEWGSFTWLGETFRTRTCEIVKSKEWSEQYSLCALSGFSNRSKVMVDMSCKVRNAWRADQPNRGWGFFASGAVHNGGPLTCNFICVKK